MQRVALLASWLINAIAAPKTPVNPVVLLGLQDEFSPVTGDRRLTPEELEASRRELIEQLGG